MKVEERAILTFKLSHAKVTQQDLYPDFPLLITYTILITLHLLRWLLS